MATQLFANNATGYLNASINTSATSIVLQSGQGALFPIITGSDWFMVTLFDGASTVEVVKCTARSSDTLTVTRAQEGTTASAFAAGVVVELRATKGTFEGLVQRDATETLTNKTLVTPALGTPSSGTLTNCTGLPPAAVSDQANTSTGYFDLPSGTTAQRPASPSSGNMRYNSTEAKFEGYNGTAWGALATAESTLAQFNASGAASVYACRAWVNFNGTGTVAIRASGNVSSITDVTTGCYFVNFSTSFTSSYCPVSSAFSASGQEHVSIRYVLDPSYANSMQSGACAIHVQNNAAASIDSAGVFAAFFGN